MKADDTTLLALNALYRLVLRHGGSLEHAAIRHLADDAGCPEAISATAIVPEPPFERGDR